jgi:hypothetical protein
MVAAGLMIFGVSRGSEENGPLHNVSGKCKTRVGLEEDYEDWADAVNENLWAFLVKYMNYVEIK